ncbi:hypothetical protein CANTEDRAFT_117366 [Yamadazyma tenuis ATCC 10573]|uniref:LDB19 N-terminal domain-containing protein n=1 Tax=Candida tenuis (strain ATCC 10573 / BCRC 21748 / CBS 615 / JCM 9827 / NBRC 10315 / NRRL Y-1498 / VKM Y-70) TaxID=590646 RepID=G3AW73_CANTC|nr:uncharacterized protein CANTEDRAFT_117366 [Yamadazyma tenuis ATCC 10573]EGV66471.1 hypothetical protein CANTEDRAFT_117366 [Yamadazyma tenuis ATCC 10573]
MDLAIELESPPAVLYGHETESTGSIVSGLLWINAQEVADVVSVTLSLVQTIHLSRPFLLSSPSVQSCKECNTRENVLARWDVVTARSSFAPGSHAYPFSHLLPGALPPSSKLGSKTSTSYIKYELVAEAVVYAAPVPVKVMLPLHITRSVLKGPDRNSLRVFPPTDVRASAVLPNVVYPKSTFPVELRLDNMNSKSGDRRWRMRKLAWRIEETCKVRAFCCPKHQSKLRTSEDAQRRSKVLTPKSKAGAHHSTIQTTVMLAPDTSVIEESGGRDPENSASGLNGAPAVAVDTEEVEQSAPTRAVENFDEDFGSRARGASESSHGPRVRGGSESSNAPSPSPASTPHTTPGSPDDLHLYVSETRTVSHGDLKSGWKSDFAATGKIDLVANINCMNVSTGLVKTTTRASSLDPGDLYDNLRHGANLSCDIDDPNEGIFVSHLLNIEVIVAEETIPVKKKRVKSSRDLTLEPTSSASSQTADEATSSSSPSQAMGTPTGAARVLRMQFKLNITERSGLGIAWDDEVPPTYEDVRTLSPPTYESSASATPQSRGLQPGSSELQPQSSDSSPLAEPPSAVLRTPGILYGIGSTPGMSIHVDSIDNMLVEDRIQDLRL